MFHRRNIIACLCIGFFRFLRFFYRCLQCKFIVCVLLCDIRLFDFQLCDIFCNPFQIFLCCFCQNQFFLGFDIVLDRIRGHVQLIFLFIILCIQIRHKLIQFVHIVFHQLFLGCTLFFYSCQPFQAFRINICLFCLSFRRCVIFFSRSFRIFQCCV